MPAETDARIARLLHHRKAGLSQGDPIIPPITASATFHLPSVQSGGQFYGRNGNPSWDAVEAQLSILEDAETASFPSGMAAIAAALFATLKAGDRLIIPSDGYYVTRVLSDGFLKPLGVTVTQIPTRDYETADFTGVAVVYLETPSNPGLDVVDINSVATRAHLAGARVIADNTTMTPLLQRPLDLGAEIRSQGPLLARINDDPDIWGRLWRTQIRLGIIPYYMFIERDTGAHRYFKVPLARAHALYRQAIRQVSGLGRTARGPSMSANPGKIEVQGIARVNGEKVMVLRFLQGRNPDWVNRPFFARYDEDATWLDQLEPAFGEKRFFFQDELDARWPGAA